MRFGLLSRFERELFGGLGAFGLSFLACLPFSIEFSLTRMDFFLCARQ